MRPEEDGRYVVCSWSEGEGKDFETLTPEGFSSRTLVHEYGGGAFFVNRYRIYFSNFKDQRMYCQKLKKLGTAPIPLTPKDKDWRYADGTLFKKHTIVCVREDHEVRGEGAAEAQATLVAINRKKKEQFVLVGCFLLFQGCHCILLNFKLKSHRPFAFKVLMLQKIHGIGLGMKIRWEQSRTDSQVILKLGWPGFTFIVNFE